MRLQLADVRHHLASLRRPLPAVLGTAALAVVSIGTAAMLNQSPEPADAHVTGAAAALSTAAPERPAAPAEAAKPDPLLLAPEAKEVSYDFQFQPNFYFCGPASTRIALSSSVNAPSQSDLAGLLGTTVNGTNSAQDTTRALNQVLGRDAYQTHWIPGQRASGAQAEQLQRDVVRAIGEGRGVVANIVGGATDVTGRYHEFGGGHYISIIGYRDRGRAVEIADPSGMFGPRTYWMETYPMANWVASRGYSA
ncbi:C39 family peptidase [Dactylosporangium sp. CA-139066]|uniref:C39 family peptidase n=1 Tax=Dactylosporangium sp. CA-139066 TaxID=3239930 RepID=UPI003D89D17E